MEITDSALDKALKLLTRREQIKDSLKKLIKASTVKVTTGNSSDDPIITLNYTLDVNIFNAVYTALKVALEKELQDIEKQLKEI